MVRTKLVELLVTGNRPFFMSCFAPSHHLRNFIFGISYIQDQQLSKISSNVIIITLVLKKTESTDAKSREAAHLFFARSQQNAANHTYHLRHVCLSRLPACNNSNINKRIMNFDIGGFLLKCVDTFQFRLNGNSKDILHEDIHAFLCAIRRQHANIYQSKREREK
jgi:hypothetical protein